MRRNRVRLLVKGGMATRDAQVAVRHTLTQMNMAFPDASLHGNSWKPRVTAMANDPKDRHVLGAAVGAHATHLVTAHLKEFPPSSIPPGITVMEPDEFLTMLLESDPTGVVVAVRVMCDRPESAADSNRRTLCASDCRSSPDVRFCAAPSSLGGLTVRLRAQRRSTIGIVSDRQRLTK